MPHRLPWIASALASRIAAKLDLVRGLAGARAAGEPSAEAVERALRLQPAWARGPASSANDGLVATFAEAIACLAGRLSMTAPGPEASRLASLVGRAGGLLSARPSPTGPTPPSEAARADIDVVSVLEDAAEILHGVARAKGVDLAAFVDPSLHPATPAGSGPALLHAVCALAATAIDTRGATAVMIQATARDERLRILVRASGGARAGSPVEPAAVETASPAMDLLRRLAERAGASLGFAATAGGPTLTLELPGRSQPIGATWPSAEGERVRVTIAGAAARSAIVRYLSAAGVGQCAADGDEPGLLVADAASLEAQSRVRSQVICVDERAEAQRLVSAGLADLAMPPPVRRDELREALRRLTAGGPVGAGAAPSPGGRRAAELAGRPGGGVAAAAELLDPQVTGELARLAAAGRGDVVARVRDLYRLNAPRAVRAVIEAAARGDSVGVQQAAQNLRSMSLNMGARVVAETSARLEAQARDLSVVNVDQAQILHRQLLATLDVLDGYPPIDHPPAAAHASPDDEALLADLEAALGNDELSLVYQAQFERDGVTIRGVEALLRWTHPVRGPLSPALFVPIAERYGVIGKVTRWVLERAMRETRDLGDIALAFNASAVEFADPAFVDELAILIARCGYAPSRLEIEITETAVLAEEDGVRRNMTRLHELGLKVALDDFGVGYSSLSHLRLFPFDKLKIDRAFVAGCPENMQSAALVNAVVSIGRALGMTVVAEGVETDAQRRFLAAAGVHAMQGYLFARPEPVEALRERLAREAEPQAIRA